MNNEIFRFGPNGSLCGILSQPEKPGSRMLCVLFVNAGVIHKVGPNGLFKQIADQLVEIEIPCFRFDFSGLGDSVFTNTQHDHQQQVIEAMSYLESNRGLTSFVLVGMCSGASSAFHVGVKDVRVKGMVLIDGVFVEDSEIRKVSAEVNRNLKIRYYKRNIMNLRKWLGVLKDKSRSFYLKTIFDILSLIGKKVVFIISPGTGKLMGTGLNQKQISKVDSKNAQLWKSLLDREARLQLIFSEGHGSWEIFNLLQLDLIRKMSGSRNFFFEQIRDTDHNFTPVWSQELLIRKIMDGPVVRLCKEKSKSTESITR